MIIFCCAETHQSKQLLMCKIPSEDLQKKYNDSHCTWYLHEKYHTKERTIVHYPQYKQKAPCLFGENGDVIIELGFDGSHQVHYSKKQDQGYSHDPQIQVKTNRLLYYQAGAHSPQLCLWPSLPATDCSSSEFCNSLGSSQASSAQGFMCNQHCISFSDFRLLLALNQPWCPRWEVDIKMTLRQSLTPAWMAGVRDKRSSMLMSVWKKELFYVIDRIMPLPLCKIGCWVLRKFKKGPHDPSIELVGIVVENETHIQKRLLESPCLLHIVSKVIM